mmetsp:Transcript_30674/g.35099  ORF Transcript_30674/g.35099 Transcript_30674/m.35099 type:complete len:186 (+) Transcript_30674:1-558(+)
MCMFPSSPYNASNGMGQAQPQGDQANPEQESLVEHLRTCVSGLSAVTGISYGLASLARVFFQTLKFLNIFKGRKETKDLLTIAWKASSSRMSLMSKLKYVVAAMVIVAQGLLYLFVRRKRAQLQIQEIREEQADLCKLEQAWEEEEISLSDFILERHKTHSVLSTDDEDWQSESSSLVVKDNLEL